MEKYGDDVQVTPEFNAFDARTMCMLLTSMQTLVIKEVLGPQRAVTMLADQGISHADTKKSAAG